MKILLPVDMSEVTDSVIIEAVTVARAMNATIEVVHVLQAIPEAMIFEETLTVLPYTYAQKDIEDERRKLLGRIKKRIEDDGITCESTLLDGDPAEEVLDYAEKTNPDWIVVGSHGHGALYHLVLGSVSEKVVDKAACPVLVVKIPPKE
ncbi:MAG: universal stress protein [Fibrobacterota bacterium]